MSNIIVCVVVVVVCELWYPVGDDTQPYPAIMVIDYTFCGQIDMEIRRTTGWYWLQIVKHIFIY